MENGHMLFVLKVKKLNVKTVTRHVTVFNWTVKLSLALEDFVSLPTLKGILNSALCSALAAFKSKQIKTNITNTKENLNRTANNRLSGGRKEKSKMFYPACLTLATKISMSLEHVQDLFKSILVSKVEQIKTKGTCCHV